MQEFEIVFYDKPDGSEPVKEFLLSVDDKMRARLLRTIDHCSENCRAEAYPGDWGL